MDNYAWNSGGLPDGLMAAGGGGGAGGAGGPGRACQGAEERGGVRGRVEARPFSSKEVSVGCLSTTNYIFSCRLRW